ncbi:MAG: RNA polymerase subunit sigma [Planctomycetales bacterium]|nr:RNA polymerase subunit sigma [Planctomycetales bacterium]
MSNFDAPTENQISNAPTEALFVRVYDELRSMAQYLMRHERADHTLCSTGLVNEAFLRMQNTIEWDSAAHFFTAAAEAMRRVLIDHARARSTQKRSSMRVPIDLHAVEDRGIQQDLDLLLDVDELLSRLEGEDSLAADFLRLRLFAGQSVVQAGQTLGLTRWSAYELWTFCQAWFASARN